MSEKITIYIKPTCTTCRKALNVLKDNNQEFDSINYSEKKLTKKSLSEIIDILDVEPAEILRKKEKIYKELGLKDKKLTKKEVVDLVIKHPDLLQRPIVVRGNKAVLARPVEKIEKMIG